jgi:hypothetical protein
MLGAYNMGCVLGSWEALFEHLHERCFVWELDP